MRMDGIQCIDGERSLLVRYEGTCYNMPCSSSNSISCDPCKVVKTAVGVDLCKVALAEHNNNRAIANIASCFLNIQK